MSRTRTRRHRPFRPFRPAWKAVKRAWHRIAPPANRGYMICATPRSGSNYLSQLLASTGLLGVPREYFQASGRRRYDDPTYPEDPREQIKQVLTTGQTANGIYAVKMHHFQISGVVRIVNPFKVLPHLRFIVLERHDAIGQAVSWSRVSQTGQARAGDDAQQEAVYDQNGIRQSLLWLMKQRAAWEETLKALKARPLLVSYEAVMQDPQLAVDRIAAFMQVRGHPRIDPALVSVTIQRDQTSKDWRARFLAETGEEFRHLADPAPGPARLARSPESD